MDCRLDTRYDNPGLVCLATQAIAATTLRKDVVSVSVLLSAPSLLSPMTIGRILSVFSFAVTLMLMSSNCLISFPQNLKGASLISQTTKNRESLVWPVRDLEDYRMVNRPPSKS